MQSSEETRGEEAQGKLWELSARLVKLEGYEPLELTPPAPEEPKAAKKEKKTKKDKSVATDEPDETAVMENEHAAENGKMEKRDEDAEKKDSEETKEVQELTAEKIKDVSSDSDKKQETSFNNGDCVAAAEDDQKPAGESNEQEVHKVEINGVDDGITASE